MAFIGHEPGRRDLSAQHSPELQAKLSTLFALAIAPLAALIVFVPRDLLMPAASALFIALAFATAVYAWRIGSDYRAHRLTFWDLAGAQTLLGFGAGALSNNSTALQLFGMVATR
jgi:Flp pilus assembly protein TadB